MFDKPTPPAQWAGGFLRLTAPQSDGYHLHACGLKCRYSTRSDCLYSSNLFPPRHLERSEAKSRNLPSTKFPTVKEVYTATPAVILKSDSLTA